ncbi:hypothetical protein A2U01_0069849, partial [Trifolium medium]|nr:hypothetical protein [Trifolium medium]
MHGRGPQSDTRSSSYALRNE